MTITVNMHPYSASTFLAPNTESQAVNAQEIEIQQPVIRRKKSALHSHLDPNFDREEMGQLPRGLLYFQAIIFQLFAIGCLITMASFAKIDDSAFVANNSIIGLNSFVTCAVIFSQK